jgi:hypothetical protein
VLRRCATCNKGMVVVEMVMNVDRQVGVICIVTFWYVEFHS